jgi:RNA polymerase sigma-70 factor (ECF subfamily)
MLFPGADLDLVLIRRCQAGDEDAFGLLFEKYKNLVYRTVYLTLGSAAEAEDLLQEVFLQVHRSLGGYDPGKGAFSTWLYRITVNRCLNWRRNRRCVESIEELGEEPAGSAGALPDSYSEDDCVRRALEKLSRKLRVVVVLRHYWDLSYAEIAQITNLPLGTVKSRLNLALRLMRDDLESDFPCLARSVTEAQR